MNDNAAPFKVGDRVTTKFHPEQKNIIRNVVSVTEYSGYKSGWAVSVDGGDPCPCCGSRKGSAIKGHDGHGADSGWFKKVEQ